MNLHEAKNIASLLDPADARQVLLALYSAKNELPEMTPPAHMAYILLCGAIRTTSLYNAAGQKGIAPNICRDAAKSIKNESNDAVRPGWVNCTSFDESCDPPIVPGAGGSVGVGGDKALQDRRFDEFWAVYPRKVGKEAARKAWRRIKPSSGLLSKMLYTVNIYKKCDQWLRDNGQYIPYPSTWLNQGRWDDEIPPRILKTSSNKLTNIGNFDQREYSVELLEQFVSSDFGKDK